MIDFIKDLVEEVKASENHTAVKYMSYGEVMDAMKKADGSFATFGEELSEYMGKNGCSFSYVTEGTMAPVITVKYHGDNNMFDNAFFGKVYRTRDGHKALYITKVSDKHKLCIENGDGTHKCFSESDDFDMPKRYINYDIVSKWNEQIVEKEFNVLADDLYSVFKDGFKQGYRKAKSER